MTRPLKPSERTHYLEASGEMIARVNTRVANVMAKLKEYSAGVSVGSGPTTKGTHSDPTAAAALATDEHNVARERIDDLIRNVYSMTKDLDSTCRLVAPLTADEAQQQRENQKAGTLQPCANAHGCPDEAWAVKAGRCENCYRVRERTGRDRRLSGGKRG